MKIKKIDYRETYILRKEVLWPTKPIDFVFVENDKEGQHFGVEVNGELQSIISVCFTDGVAQFRKFATKKSAQGKGYGSALLRHVMEVAIQAACTKIWCNARVDKASFYERFDLTETEKRYEKGGVKFVVMERNFQ